MPPHRPQKQLHGWRNIACFAVLGLTALWTLSRAPRFEARRGAVTETLHTDHHSSVSATVKESGLQQSSTSTSRLRLLLSTHNRLFWYYPDTREDVAVHEGQARIFSFSYHISCGTAFIFTEKHDCSSRM
jgi:hypothetical protein